VSPSTESSLARSSSVRSERTKLTGAAIRARNIGAVAAR
jgi:hypothetical protein